MPVPIEEFWARVGSASPRELRALLEQLGATLPESLRNSLGLSPHQIPVDPGVLRQFVESEHIQALFNTPNGQRVKDFIDQIASGKAQYPSYVDEGRFLRPPAGTPKMREAYVNLEAEVWAALGLTPDGGPIIPISKIENRILREEFRRRMNTIMGLAETVDTQGIGTLIHGATSSYYSDIIDPAHDVDWASVWYEQRTKQFKVQTAKEGQALSSAVTTAQDAPSMSALDTVTAQRTGAVPFPDSYATIDIETTGLDKETQRIWQVAIRGSDGREMTLYFHPPGLDMGTTKTGTLAEGFLAGHTPSSFDEIQQGLQMLSEYEGVVGQNIRNYDLPFLESVIGRMGGAARQTPEFKALFEGFKKRNRGPNVFDTLDMVMGAMDQTEHKLNIAPELMEMGRGTQRGLENLLLQTNLLELAQAHHNEGGEWSTENLLARLRDAHLHDASVDTIFEELLHKEIADSASVIDPDTKRPQRNIEPRPGGFRAVDDAGEVDLEGTNRIRRAILERHAMTPYTTMGHHEVAQEVLDLLERSQHAGEYIKDYHFPDTIGDVKEVALNPFEHRVIQGRLRAPKGLTEIGDLTATSLIEQLKVMRDQTRPVNALLTGAGKLRRNINPFNPNDPPFDPKDPTKVHLPTLEEQTKMQQALFDKGIPHANLDYMERLVSESIHAASHGPAERVLTGGLVPHGRWHVPQKAMIFGGSGRMSLPLEILRDAGLAPEDQVYRLNEFPPKENIREISLNRMFDPNKEVAERQAKELIEYLKQPSTMAKFREQGINSEFIARLDALGHDVLAEHGVQVGTLTKDALGGSGDVQNEVRRAHDLLFQAKGEVSVSGQASNVTQFGVTLVGAPDAEGLIESSPAFVEKTMEGDKLAAHMAETKVASEFAGKVAEEIGSDEVLRRTVEYAVKKDVDISGLKILGKLSEANKFYKRNKLGVRGALAAGALTAAYYIKKRHEKHQAWFDQPFQQQPLENDQYQADLQAQIGHVSMAQYTHGKTDPLSTAGVVGTLDRNKIGHTVMGAGKNSHLFGGGY